MQHQTTDDGQLIMFGCIYSLYHYYHNCHYVIFIAMF